LLLSNNINNTVLVLKRGPSACLFLIVIHFITEGMITRNVIMIILVLISHLTSPIKRIIKLLYLISN